MFLFFIASVKPCHFIADPPWCSAAGLEKSLPRKAFFRVHSLLVMACGEHGRLSDGLVGEWGRGDGCHILGAPGPNCIEHAPIAE